MLWLNPKPSIESPGRSPVGDLESVSCGTTQCAPVETTTTMSSDSNPPCTLKSLWSYAHRQECLIQRLLEPENLYFSPTPFQAWVQLHSSRWGKNPDSLEETEPVIRGPDAIDDQLILPDVLPSNRSVMPKPASLDECWTFDAKKFLIRPEYKEAKEYVLSMSGSAPGVVIAGQPGIGLSLFCLASTGSQGLSSGKSVFLLYILLCRLAHKLPTVLHIRSSYALLFHEGGVKEFKQLGTYTYNKLASEVGPLGRIWALVDSNDDLIKPSSLFKDGPFFVVLATPPRPIRDDWPSGKAFRFFYMKMWAFSEVLQV